MVSREQRGLGASKGGVGKARGHSRLKGTGRPLLAGPRVSVVQGAPASPRPAREGRSGGHRAADAQAGRDRFSAAHLSSQAQGGGEDTQAGRPEAPPRPRGGGRSGRGAGLTQGEAERQGGVGELQALLRRLHLSQQRGQLVAEPQLGLPAPYGHRQGQRPVLGDRRQVRPTSPHNGQPGPCRPEGPQVCPREPTGASCEIGRASCRERV